MKEANTPATPFFARYVEKSPKVKTSVRAGSKHPVVF